MGERSEIYFVRPYRQIFEKSPELTVDHIRRRTESGRYTQIYLDNCSIQRMEKLPEVPTIADAERAGLLNLVAVLQAPGVVLSATGLNEMPGSRKEKARAAYERFCASFFPNHIDEIGSNSDPYPDVNEERIDYWDLDENSRQVLGPAYSSLLLIKLIARTHREKQPEDRLREYFFGVAQMLKFVHGLHLEIAKYEFWDFDNRDKTVPESVKIRRKLIRENFTIQRQSLKKCRADSLGGAFDLQYLDLARAAYGRPESLGFPGTAPDVELWLGTHDRKLYEFCEHAMPLVVSGSATKHVELSRENEISAMPYWQIVDEFSDAQLGIRQATDLSRAPTVAEVEAAVRYLEGELQRSYEEAAP